MLTNSYQSQSINSYRPCQTLFKGCLVALLLVALAACSTNPTQGDQRSQTVNLKTDQVIVAHRGASGYAPEHTLLAYDLGLTMGAEYIEQDVFPTKDGVLVCIHDDTLDRTARGPVENCTGKVSDKTLAQLKTCDMGSWFNEVYPGRAQPEYVGLQIPTLDEVFARYGTTTNYYIEIKPNSASLQSVELTLLDLIHEHGLYQGMVDHHQVLVQSFVPASLQAMATLDPAVPLIQLARSGSKADSILAADYAIGVGPSIKDTNQALVNRAHQLGLAVHPYTVNSSADLAAAAALCVDGLFTNFPDRYREILETTQLDCPAPIR